MTYKSFDDIAALGSTMYNFDCELMQFADYILNTHNDSYDILGDSKIEQTINEFAACYERITSEVSEFNSCLKSHNVILLCCNAMSYANFMSFKVTELSRGYREARVMSMVGMHYLALQSFLEELLKIREISGSRIGDQRFRKIEQVRASYYLLNSTVH